MIRMVLMVMITLQGLSTAHGGLMQQEVVMYGKFVELSVVARLDSVSGDLTMHVAMR